MQPETPMQQGPANPLSRNVGLALGRPSQSAQSVFRNLPLGVKIELCGKICASSLRRFLYRIRNIQTYKTVDLGPAFQRLPDGSFGECARTHARSLGTDKLLARYGWADTEDARIFLEGFDAGEEWILRTQGK